MPPCNCHPPFPRPEPFSPLPRPGKTPDWGKWIRDRLAEKGALLVFPTRASFPSPGAWPNLYLDQETGAVYRWDREDYAVLFGPREGNDVLVYDSVAAFPDEGEQGKLYIAANTGSLYRWGGEGYVALLPGKADKVVPAAEGNLAELTQDGNLADSGKKPADFADAENTYTKAETDEAIDRVAAYYITRNAAGDAFETKAQLNSATVFYSGGKVRTPTRNDYCVVLADETHDNAEYRYIYAVADGETTGSWQPQFPVEGVMTIDQTVTKNSQNPVSGGGVWSMLWGALQNIPEGLSSVYAWVLNRLGLKRDYTDLSYDTTETVTVPALHAAMKYNGQTLFDYDLLCTEEIPDPPEYNHLYTWRADGGVSPGAEIYVTQMVSALTTTWTLYSQTSEVLDTVQTSNSGGLYPDFTFSTEAGIDVDIHKTTAQKTVTVEDELALKSGVPAPSTATPAMDGAGAAGSSTAYARGDHVHPSDTSRVPTSRTVNGKALSSDVTLTGADIEADEGSGVTIAAALESIGATAGQAAADATTALQDLASKANNADVVHKTGDETIVGNKTFHDITAFQDEVLIESGSLVVGTVGVDNTNFYAGGIRTYGHQAPIQYPAYNGLGNDFFALIQHIAPDYNGETSHTYAVNELRAYQGSVYRCTTAHTATSWVAANWALATVEDVLAALRTGKADASDLLAKLDSTSAAPAFSTSSTYAVGDHVIYNGALYRCTTAVTTAGAWDSSKWAEDTMTDPDAVLDITAQNQLRVVAKDGTILWAQGYDLASTSSATLACDAVNNFTFADGATTQAFTLPTAPIGKVGDFGLDIDNFANTSAATISFSNVANNTASVIIPKGENLNDMLSIAAGELARFYISLSTFRVNNLPTWHILKQVVENGGATV